MFVVTDEAWQFFMQHHDAIRECECVREFGSRAAFDRFAYDSNPRPLTTNFEMEAFDQAVAEKDAIKLADIMNDAWFRAPDQREVYRTPGFRQMCDLLDGTVPGFVPDDDD